MIRKYFLAALASAAFATGANATTIDFNSAASGDYATLTISGVTFTPVGGGVIKGGCATYGCTPNGTPGLIATNGAFVPVKAVFSGTVTSVSIDIGDFNSDADNLFLRLYDASDNLLAQDTDFIAASFTGMVNLSASAAGTAYAIFGGVGYLQEANVYYDNLVFDGRGAVPEASTWAMMILGLGLAGGTMRRARKTQVRFA
ncbi:MAG: PEP-CTERM sorting domain-containing protein [Sphingobium sp.]|nr:PEP-CTERM sorting domain-containing protein [Sphingobium sp.]